MQAGYLLHWGYNESMNLPVLYLLHMVNLATQLHNRLHAEPSR